MKWNAWLVRTPAATEISARRPKDPGYCFSCRKTEMRWDEMRSSLLLRNMINMLGDIGWLWWSCWSLHSTPLQARLRARLETERGDHHPACASPASPLTARLTPPLSSTCGSEARKQTQSHMSCRALKRWQLLHGHWTGPCRHKRPLKFTSLHTSNLISWNCQVCWLTNPASGDSLKEFVLFCGV